MQFFSCIIIVIEGVDGKNLAAFKLLAAPSSAPPSSLHVGTNTRYSNGQCSHETQKCTLSYTVALLRDHAYGQAKGGPSNEMASDEGEFSMGHTYSMCICSQ